MVGGVRPDGGAARGHRRGSLRSRAGGGGDGHVRPRSRRHRRGPGARPAAPPRRRSHPARGCRRRRRRGAAGLLRCFQHGCRRPGAPGHGGHDHAQRHGDPPPAHARRALGGDAVLAGRVGHGHRRRGHHDPAVRSPPRRRSDGRIGRGGRRALRSGGQSQPPRRPVGGRSGPRSGRTAGRAVRAARTARRDLRGSGRGVGVRGDPGSGPVRALQRAPAAQRLWGPNAAATRSAPAGAGHATHQLRRGPLQLRDAGDRPAVARLRRRPSARGATAGAPRRRGRAGRDPRRCRAHPQRRRRRDRRRFGQANRHRRRDGWCLHGDLRGHRRGAARSRMVESTRHRPHVPPPGSAQ